MSSYMRLSILDHFEPKKATRPMLKFTLTLDYESDSIDLITP
jgi:hypothetical protein